MDSNFNENNVDVVEVAEGNYSVTYRISSNNLVENVPCDTYGGLASEECHRTCDIVVGDLGGSNTTAELALYNGDPNKNYAWASFYLSEAFKCSSGAVSSYFLENNTCTRVIRSTSGTYEAQRFPDITYSGKKYTSPATAISDCDNLSDCAYRDCASVVYGEPYIVNGSNINKITQHVWTCPADTVGWRDDPPTFCDVDLDPGACDLATNLCTDDITGSGGTTTITYTRVIRGGGNFSMRFEQSSVGGKGLSYGLDAFNETLYTSPDTEFFKVLDYSPSTSLTNLYTVVGTVGEGKTVTAASGNPAGPNSNSNIDMTFKVQTNASSPYWGLHCLRVKRLVDSAYVDFIVQYNVSSTGPLYEHDVSCSDNYDNDLDYAMNCLDSDCDYYVGNPSDLRDVCAYQNLNNS
jgi:hypothetical protein